MVSIGIKTQMVATVTKKDTMLSAPQYHWQASDFLSHSFLRTILTSAYIDNTQALLWSEFVLVSRQEVLPQLLSNTVWWIEIHQVSNI